MTLVKEDGSAIPTANAYADVADADSYYEGHCYASAWTGATTPNKEKALIMATRLIDVSYQFNGFRKTYNQALQWPRVAANDPDRNYPSSSILEIGTGPYFASDAVPALLVQATCELARELLLADRTAAPDGEGIRSFGVSGGISITFDASDRRPIIPPVVQSMLSKLGCLIYPTKGTVRLVRS